MIKCTLATQMVVFGGERDLPPSVLTLVYESSGLKQEVQEGLK